MLRSCRSPRVRFLLRLCCLPSQFLLASCPPSGNYRTTGRILFYTRVVVIALKQWVQEIRSRGNEEDYFVEELVSAQNFVAFLQEHHGAQWESKFLQAAAEPLFEQMLAYIAGYVKLTSTIGGSSGSGSGPGRLR